MVTTVWRAMAGGGEGGQQEAKRAAMSRDVLWNVEGPQRRFARGGTGQGCSLDTTQKQAVQNVPEGRD